MNVLVIGNGGREHALAWKLAASPKVDRIFCAPGNPCMRETTALPIAVDDIAGLVRAAEENDVALTMVGPEVPLCRGVVDAFRERGLRIVGPDRRAAELEGSKTRAKEFMARHGIPTAAYRACDSEQEARDAVITFGAPVVIKADGLAAGKGVTVAATTEEALAAVAECFEGRFGAAGTRVVVEECLVGEEASILALTDGITILPLASSQDHKRVGEGDTGPNTGGMGAYSPAPVVTPQLWDTVRERVLTPFLNGCEEENLDYRGIIYAGIMITQDGPRVLEFNVRFGDPETQAVLMRLDSDLAEALCATADRTLADITLAWSDEPAVCVVLASGGYPGTYEKGHPIAGLDEAAARGAVVFHAGTTMDEAGHVVTNGGRVLGVTTRGTTLPEAVRTCYHAVDAITWNDMQFRRDIAHRAL